MIPQQPATELDRIKMKFSLSIGASASLQEVLANMEAGKKHSYFIELEQVLDNAIVSGKDPSAEVPDIVSKIMNGEPLLMPWLEETDDEEDIAP